VPGPQDALASLAGRNWISRSEQFLNSTFLKFLLDANPGTQTLSSGTFLPPEFQLFELGATSELTGPLLTVT
jgi:hypothetical protein